MNANVIEVKPFNITKIELVALRGPKGDTGYPSPEEIQAAVDAWLEDHPEATTTVQDGAITTPKLADEAVTVDKLSESLQSLLITDTASGSIASFSDGSDGIPVKGLEVNIEPKQDLHGYANPWPAGGGKNIVNEDSILQGGWDGTASTNNCYTDGYIPITPSTAYTWSQTGSTNGRYARFFDSSKTFIDGASITQYNTTVATFTSPSNAYYMQLQWYSSSAITPTDIKALKPMIEKGSTATAYAPYSNICPITGWDEVKVTRAGKNLGNLTYGNQVPSVLNGQMVSASGWSSDYIRVYPSQEYISTFANNPAGRYVLFYDINKNYLGYNNHSSDSYRLSLNEYWSKTAYLKFRADGDSSAQFTWQLELGTTATAYSPYQGDTYTISLSSAGTVYGGTLDVTTGMLTVDRAMKNSGWSRGAKDSSGKLYNIGVFAGAIKTDSVSVPDGVISNSLPITNLSAGRASASPCMVYYGTVDVIAYAGGYIGKEAELDSLLQTLVAVYPLATPTTVQLTPQQLTTLLGQNNIFADCGNVEVDYVADTKLYIAKMIANALNS